MHLIKLLMILKDYLAKKTINKLGVIYRFNVSFIGYSG